MEKKEKTSKGIFGSSKVKKCIIGNKEKQRNKTIILFLSSQKTQK